MRPLHVVALQSAGVPNDPAASLAQFSERVRTLGALFPATQLVVAPELHLSGCAGLLDEPGDYPERVAVELPGPLTEALGALARETGLWLLPGSVYERLADGGVANTLVALSPEGDVAALYRKCFPWQPYETSRPGSTSVTFDLPGLGRVGLAICHDGVFPELLRQLAWSGAEAIFQVSLTGTADRDAEVAVVRANAIVNQVHIVNVNASTPVGNGRSVVVDPEGVVRYEAGGGEEVVTAILDFDQVTLARTRGSFGMNRLWEQFDRAATSLDLPMYGGPLRPRPDREEHAG
jgi:formamidase